MPMDEDIRTIVKEALRDLDTSHQHGAGEVEELRSRVDTLVELVRDVLKKTKCSATSRQSWRPPDAER